MECACTKSLYVTTRKLWESLHARRNVPVVFQIIADNHDERQGLKSASGGNNPAEHATIRQHNRTGVRLFALHPAVYRWEQRLICYVVSRREGSTSPRMAMDFQEC